MVKGLLVRGMLAGLAAGVIAFAFAWAFGEPQVNLAIAFEDHMHRMAGDAPEPVLVSRAVQSTIGLMTGVLVYGAALGGIFALVFAYAQGRIGQGRIGQGRIGQGRIGQGRMGPLGPRAAAAVLAVTGFVALILVPQIKYPANPPSIGNPETIGSRTALYFTMIALSVIAAVAAVSTGRQLARRLGGWNAATLAGAAYLAVVAAAMLILPPVNEVPADFSAATLWNFRLASLGIEVVLWTGLALIFGVLAERRLAPKGRGVLRVAR